MYTKIKQQLFL